MVSVSCIFWPFRSILASKLAAKRTSEAIQFSASGPSTAGGVAPGQGLGLRWLKREI